MIYPFFISRERVLQSQIRSGYSKEKQMQKFAFDISKKGMAPISHYQVGAAFLGESGNIYLGVNLEFAGVPLSQTIHAEQFGIINALNHGEKKLLFLAVTAPPCGCCRQWISEIGKDSSRLKVLISNGKAVQFSRLFPYSFKFSLQGESTVFFSSLQNFDRKASDKLLPARLRNKDLWLAALRGVKASYSPYSKSPSGLALMTKDRKVYVGSYIENSAFNPSLSPLHTALISLVCDGQPFGSIKKARLLEKNGAAISQEETIKELLKKIAPQVSFQKASIL
jgi:cytidine deaminase